MFITLVLFFSMMGSTSSQADVGCPQFLDLVSRSEAVQAPFGDLDNPNCSNKPEESEINSLISCFESGIPNYVSRYASEADLQLSSLYGAITQCYRFGTGKITPGKKSYTALEDSTVADPTYEKAWLSFGDTVAGFKKEGSIKKIFISKSLGIDINQKVEEAIQGLESLPQTDAVRNMLAKLRS